MIWTAARLQLQPFIANMHANLWQIESYNFTCNPKDISHYMKLQLEFFVNLLQLLHRYCDNSIYYESIITWKHGFQATLLILSDFRLRDWERASCCLGFIFCDWYKNAQYIHYKIFEFLWCRYFVPPNTLI